jgi:interferon gamma-inducible protein 30
LKSKKMKFATIAATIGAVAAYADDSKMKIDLYYESQCPACRAQVTTNFMKAINTPGFVDMADITLHPYGNARESAGTDGQWNFQCQHGEVECQWNLLEACALDYNQNG